MSEVDFAEVRDSGTGIAEIADSVQAGHDDVADGINGGADVAGRDYADAGGAYAAEAAPRLQAVLAECVAVLRDVSAALTDTAAAYRQTEETVVASLKSIPTPWV